MIKDIVFASSNKNKINEISQIAQKFEINILTPKDVAEKLSLKSYKDPEENGTTYLENALIKAKACYEWCKLPSLGDDSGLEVEILNNAPGILSARYAGENSTDSMKISQLVKETEAALIEQNSENRNARFRCFLVLINNQSEILQSQGVLDGTVLSEPRGERGFGYDPIIHINEFNLTLAEADEELILNQGFRAKAAMELFTKVRKKHVK